MRGSFRWSSLSCDTYRHDSLEDGHIWSVSEAGLDCVVRAKPSSKQIAVCLAHEFDIFKIGCRRCALSDICVEIDGRDPACQPLRSSGTPMPESLLCLIVSLTKMFFVRISFLPHSIQRCVDFRSKDLGRPFFPIPLVSFKDCLTRWLTHSCLLLKRFRTPIYC